MILDQTLNFITILAWILLGIFIISYFLSVTLRYGPGEAARSIFGLRWLIFAILGAVCISLLSFALVFINPQEAAVVISLVSSEGYRDRPFRSGLHWIIPLMENVQKYPIYYQTYTMSVFPMEGENRGDDSITARTSDGQEVRIDSSIIFQIDPQEVIRVDTDWQNRYIEDFIRPVMRGLVRTKVSQYTVDEVNSSKRLDLEKDLGNDLRNVFEDKGFVMDRFILRNITFSQEYAASVEQKQVALQDMTKKKYEADQIRILSAGQADQVRVMAKAEADAIQMKAEAEASALRLLNDALGKNKDLITLRYVDKLAPGIKVMLVPSNSPFILPIPTEDLVDTPKTNTQQTQQPGQNQGTPGSNIFVFPTPTNSFPINTSTPAPQTGANATTPSVINPTPVQ